ncbi:hypothetical protein BH11PLA2_BH11PLA2_16980 [soil metagenome]
MRTLFTLIVMAVPTLAAEPKNELPAAWHGIWTGKLELPKDQTVTMELVIEPIKDTRKLRWQITYGEGGKASIRKYELVPDDFVAGRFLLDEKNGILLDMKFAKGVMHSQFEVSGSLLTARYELRDGKLHYEITTAGKAIETGTKDSAIVKVYPVTSTQTAVLSKSK